MYCSSPMCPKEGAVGFKFSDPKGVEGIACQDKKERKKKGKAERC